MTHFTSLGRSAVLVLVGLSCACGATDPAPGPAGSQTPAARRGAAPRTDLGQDLDLMAMLAPVPEYEGSGRNLFTYGAVDRQPQAGTVAPRPTAERPTNRATPRGGTGRAQPRPAQANRLGVQYAGFVEKTRTSGAKEKYAIFISGSEILTGAEGDNLGNFTVVEIGLESVTVTARGSSATTRIPLEAN